MKHIHLNAVPGPILGYVLLLVLLLCLVWAIAPDGRHVPLALTVLAVSLLGLVRRLGKHH